MPKVLHVEEFPEMGQMVDVPALLYGLTDLTLGEDRATGQTALIGRFQSCILVDATATKASLQAAILASQLVVTLRYQMWGLDFVTGPPENIHAQPEPPQQDLEQFVMWSVQWTQAFEIGTLEWPWPDEPPGSLMFGLDDAPEDEFFPPESPP
ncbi:hypothetical protein IB251_06220 [Pseudomonas sp. PDM07]|nr:hypothetical protein [Pseudomonas sp. PDM07]